ncbi:hypothetical protein OGAPHI_002737 [Ogataea philodendri]|uniref:Uncharacterized protein n=1 Tax=Ogataea philodendri TaxID=1378263 RepID=A0A9P8PCX0_9ASCO|nr:uncharacterized protein OGAPHI_002737 [Ogataea philodendri]KAH3668982.1 hypothetical protein OGAPHI_002737 [Ogataea philodendri]
MVAPIGSTGCKVEWDKVNRLQGIGSSSFMLSLYKSPKKHSLTASEKPKWAKTNKPRTTVDCFFSSCPKIVPKYCDSFTAMLKPLSKQPIPMHVHFKAVSSTWWLINKPRNILKKAAGIHMMFEYE